MIDKKLEQEFFDNLEENLIKADIAFKAKAECTTSEDILTELVRKYWTKTGFPHDVVCYFKQKHSQDEEWEKRYIRGESMSDSDSDSVLFYEEFFREGQEDIIKDIHLVDLEKILDYYGEAQIWKH